MVFPLLVIGHRHTVSGPGYFSHRKYTNTIIIEMIPRHTSNAELCVICTNTYSSQALNKLLLFVVQNVFHVKILGLSVDSIIKVIKRISHMDLVTYNLRATVKPVFNDHLYNKTYFL